MQISRKILIFSLILTAIFSAMTLTKVFAQSLPISDQQLQQIRDNCISTKSTLAQLHSSDALLRVNIGQTYESMSTKLMERFNSRVVDNNLNGSELISITADYGASLDNFRSNYMIYEKRLSSTMNIDCSLQPAAFYDSIAATRDARSQVRADVVKLNSYLDQYKLAIDKFTAANQAKLEGKQ